MGIHLKDIIEVTCRKAEQDGNGKNIDATYQKKLGIGTFTGNIDGLGDGGLPYTSSICWCQSNVVEGTLPYESSNAYWFVLETNIVLDDRTIRSQRATVYDAAKTRLFERLHTNGEWYAWKEYLRTDGDLKDTTVSFTSGDDLNPTGWTAIGKIFSGGQLKDMLNGFSTGIKNLRFLYKLIGTTDISKIGDGTLTGIVNSLNTDIKEKFLIKSENKNISVGTNASAAVTFTVKQAGYNIAGITPASPTGAYTVCVGSIDNVSFSVIARNFSSVASEINIRCQIILMKN